MQKTNWNDPPFYSVYQLFRLGHGFNSKLFTRGYPQIVDVYSLRVSLRMMEYLMRYEYIDYHIVCKHYRKGHQFVSYLVAHYLINVWVYI